MIAEYQYSVADVVDICTSAELLVHASCPLWVGILGILATQIFYIKVPSYSPSFYQYSNYRSIYKTSSYSGINTICLVSDFLVNILDCSYSSIVSNWYRSVLSDHSVLWHTTLTSYNLLILHRYFRCCKMIDHYNAICPIGCSSVLCKIFSSIHWTVPTTVLLCQIHIDLQWLLSVWFCKGYVSLLLPRLP